MTDSLIPISASLSPAATPANAPLLAFLNQYRGSTRRTYERYLSMVVNLSDGESDLDPKERLLLFDWQRVDVHFCNRILRLCQDRKSKTGEDSPYFRSTRKTLLIVLRGIAKQRRILGQIDIEQYRDIEEVGGKARGDNPAKTAKSISPEDLLKMLNACERDENKLLGKRDFALLSLLFGSGLRAAEAIALKRSQIDFSEQRLTVVGKGQNERIVYPVEGVLEALGEWIQEYNLEMPVRIVFSRGSLHINEELEKDFFIFPPFSPPSAGGRIIEHRREFPLSYSALYAMVRKRALQAGIAVPSPHWFRHSFATETYKQTRDLYGLQHQLGHASGETTKLYIAQIEETEAKKRAGASWKLPRPGKED